MNNSKVYVFDLETTNLAANGGYILCACVCDVNTGQVWTYRIDKTKEWKKQKWDDSGVVKALINKLGEADVWVAHYGGRFDVPFLRTRALVHGLPDIPPTPLVDTWRVARNHLKLSSNRLAALTDLLKTHPKTPLNLTDWAKASAGCITSLNLIVEHCIADVVALKEVYIKLRGIIKDHPNVALLNHEHAGDRCPNCNSHKLQKRGKHIARTRWRQRYQCQDCGHWSKGPSLRMTNVTIS
jgi:uncharacterized protein YprB with RNaseH-like and TPR domain/predicted RNA-binding Zn-ribbon protein involved in translation (DUF1610 family)